MDKAVRMDKILNRNGRSLAGYPSGTLPIKCGLSAIHSDSRCLEAKIRAGPEGCVPILIHTAKMSE